METAKKNPSHEIIPKAVLASYFIIVVIATIILFIYVLSNQRIHYTFQKNLYRESGIANLMKMSIEYTSLFSFDPRPYFEQADRKAYEGYFEIIINGANANNTATFVVRKENNGVNLGEEIVVSSNFPTKIPFEVKNQTRYLNLCYKTISVNLVFYELSISIF